MYETFVLEISCWLWEAQATSRGHLWALPLNLQLSFLQEPASVAILGEQLRWALATVLLQLPW